jgi:hypothetical protein
MRFEGPDTPVPARAHNGGGLSAELCRLRAQESRGLPQQTDIAAVRVMLEHVATTWERIAEELANPKD